MQQNKHLQVFTTGAHLVPTLIDDKWVWVVSGFQDETYFDGAVADAIVTSSDTAQGLFHIEYTFEHFVNLFEPIKGFTEDTPNNMLHVGTPHSEYLFDTFNKDKLYKMFLNRDEIFPYQIWHVERIQGEVTIELNFSNVISKNNIGFMLTEVTDIARNKVII